MSTFINNVKIKKIYSIFILIRGDEMKNKKQICIMCIILSVYLTFNILIVLNLPTIFYSFISWMGNEEMVLT